MPTHICRFKVVSVECAAMPAGQSYLIRYIRGDTDRSTPSFQASANGVVDFSRMPEGAAILHFKKNKNFDPSNPRPYAPKYIQFRVDEYHQRSARRPVGETMVDCSLVVDLAGNAGGKVLSKNFYMYGKPAKIRVAIIVYREGGAPLSFEPLLDGSNATAWKEEEKQRAAKRADEKVKVMAREEAHTLLISLEALQDRKNRDGTAVSSFPDLDNELEALEAKRKSIVGTEGLASQVVRARCHDCIEAQFHDLRTRYRAHFIGVTAAYLRQMALTHKFSPDDYGSGAAGSRPQRPAADTEVERGEIRLKISHLEERIDQIRSELQRLEAEQEQLQQSNDIDSCVDVIIANTTRIDSAMSQLKVLQLSHAALVRKLQATPPPPPPPTTRTVASNPLELEIHDIKSRVAALKAKEPELKQKINHMNSVAISYVVNWARGKNPSEQDEAALKNVDQLFEQPAPSAPPDLPSQDFFKEDQQQQQPEKEEKEKAGEKNKKKGSSSRSSSASSSGSSEGGIPGLKGVPSPKDFNATERNNDEDEDPFAKAGLSKDIFSSSYQQPRAGGTEPLRNNFFRDPTPEESQGFGRGRTETSHPSSRRNSVGPSGNKYEDYVRVKRAEDPYYDPINDFNAPTSWGDGSAMEMPVERELDTSDLRAKANDWFRADDGGHSHNESPEDSNVPSAVNRPTYDFGSAEMKYQSFYTDSLPKYDFGS